MTRRLIVVAVVLLLAALAWPAIAQAAPTPPPGPAQPATGPGQRSMGPGAGRMGPGPGMMGGPEAIKWMVDRLGERLGLTEKEKGVVGKAMRAKLEARQALTQERRALSDVAGNKKTTDEQLRGALRKYHAAVATYRARVKAIDDQLGKSVSLRARAGLTAEGVIDNGLGTRFGGRMGRGAEGEGRRGEGPRGTRRGPAPAPGAGEPRGEEQ